MSLIEVLVSLGILSIMVAGMTSYMLSSSREVKALTESLAKLDVEKLLIASLADGAACTAELANPGLWTPGALPYTINTTSAATIAGTIINLNTLHAGGLAASVVLIDNVNPVSPMSQSLTVNSIEMGNFVSTGVPNQYSADLTVSFKGSVRSLKPIILKKLITTAPSSPGSEKITACLGAGSAPVGIGPFNNEVYGVTTGYGGCYTLPNYGTWAVMLNSISYWPPSTTSGAGPPVAQGVFPGGKQWCGVQNASEWQQITGSVWRVQ